MTDLEIKTYLAKHTNMSEYDINRHIKDGVAAYKNTEDGFCEYRRSFSGSFEDEEITKSWSRLDIIGDYRMEFIL